MEESEERICEFKKYAKQTVDLMIDSYKWKVLAEDCDNINTKNRYMQISNTMYDLFMEQHNHISEMFKTK